MFKLYGLRMSNYYSLTKALLIEKGFDFEEIKAPPSQKADYLERSPMGKMPSLELDGVHLSESMAIFHFLEAQRPGLMPADPMAAAKVVELVLHLMLNVELVARRCLPELLFNQPVSDETKEEVARDLEKGYPRRAAALLLEHLPSGRSAHGGGFLPLLLPSPGGGHGENCGG